MLINKTTIKKLEHTYKRSFTDDFKRYLLIKYAEEPFPYEFSGQDLYTNIKNDIRDYEVGELDITVKSPSDRWCEEREYLKTLYIEKAARHVILRNMLPNWNIYGLESYRMSERRTTRATAI